MDNNNPAHGSGSSTPDSEADGKTPHVPPPPAKPPVNPGGNAPAGIPPAPARTPAAGPEKEPAAEPAPDSSPASRDPRGYDTVDGPPYVEPVYAEPAEARRGSDGRTKQILINASIIVTGLVLLGALAWGVLTVLNMGSPNGEAGGGETAPAATEAAALPLPREGVSPLDFRVGDCFKDFDPNAEKSTVVACDTEHSAQLVAVHHYEDNNAYPGLNALREKGREVCQNAKLAASSANYVLLQRNSYPSTTSWEIGDRRVDCYVTADAGNVITENLIPAD